MSTYRTWSATAEPGHLPPPRAAPAPRAGAEEAKEPRLPDLAKVKQEEAREKLARLEEAMDRLSRILAQAEPQNAAKLRAAFQQSRERLVREGMDRILELPGLEGSSIGRSKTSPRSRRGSMSPSISSTRTLTRASSLKHIPPVARPGPGPRSGHHGVGTARSGVRGGGRGGQRHAGRGRSGPGQARGADPPSERDRGQGEGLRGGLCRRAAVARSGAGKGSRGNQGPRAPRCRTNRARAGRRAPSGARGRGRSGETGKHSTRGPWTARREPCRKRRKLSRQATAPVPGPRRPRRGQRSRRPRVAGANGWSASSARGT